MKPHSSRIAMVSALLLAQAGHAGDTIGGSTDQTFNMSASCRNLTTGQAVNIPGLGGSPAWDCTAAGLLADPDDVVLQQVRGRARCGPGNPCQVGAQITGVEDIVALCRNLDTGQSAFTGDPDGDNAFTCPGAFSAITGQRLLLFVRGSVPAGPLPECTITFDTGCPNQMPQCGASFAGGNGCIVAGLPFCYDTGLFGYEVSAGDLLTITLEGDLNSLDVFFASGGAGSGQMTFFDADGAEVDAPITTNGDCTLAMPPTQLVNFSRPVRTIVVENDGPSRLYLDTFHVNPQ